MHYLNTRDLPGEALVLNLIYLLYNPRDFKYRVWHPTTILLSRSCHWMDHRECGLTWKLVCQSALYSPFKVSKLGFSATNLVWKRMFFQWSYEQKYYFLQSGEFPSVKNVDYFFCKCVIDLLSSYLLCRDKRSWPWPLVII